MSQVGDNLRQFINTHIINESLIKYLIFDMEMEPMRLGKPKSYLSSFDFKNGKVLVDFLNKIPNLESVKFKLSEEECEVVGENSNLIVIGRSGTGKTTCALMRMFAI